MSSPVPDGWEMKSLNDFCVRVTDGTHDTPKRQRSGIRLATSKNLNNGKLELDNSYFISQEDFEEIEKRSKVDVGDVIYGMIGTIGNPTIIQSLVPPFAIKNVALFKFNDDHPKAVWLKNYLNSDEFLALIEQNQTGNAQRFVGLGFLRSVHIPIPSYPEQTKIATILTSVDTVIEKTQAQINKLKDLKTGMMQELLTKGIGHTEFKDSPVGKIPVEWEVVTVGDLVDVIDPQPDHRTPAEVEGGVPYIGLGDIDKSGSINFKGARKVSQEAYEKQLRSFDIHEQSFIFGKIGTIGNPSILPNERFYCLSANVVLITTENLLIMQYIYQTFMSEIINEQVLMQTNTTSQPALGIKKTRKFLIPIPLNQQEIKNIVNSLGAVDNKTNSILSRLEGYKSLKKSLMQDLLTGKVRVRL